MTMTQRYAGALRRHAAKIERQAMQVQAEFIREAARHMEDLRSTKDAAEAARSWKPIRTAPKDGSVVLVLLGDSDVPHAARWLRGPDDPRATEMTAASGWHMTWDGTPVPEHGGPRYWMRCEDDPDAADEPRS